MKMMKKLLISVIAIFLIVCMYSMNNVESSAGFIEKGAKLVEGQSPAIDVKKITGELVPIGQLLSVIGVGVLIAATGYLGIEYFISPPDKQGALKEKLVGIFISGIVIFGAYSIWSWAVNIFEKL